LKRGEKSTEIEGGIEKREKRPFGNGVGHIGDGKQVHLVTSVGWKDKARTVEE